MSVKMFNFRKIYSILAKGIVTSLLFFKNHKAWTHEENSEDMSQNPLTDPNNRDNGRIVEPSPPRTETHSQIPLTESDNNVNERIVEPTSLKTKIPSMEVPKIITKNIKPPIWHKDYVHTSA